MLCVVATRTVRKLKEQMRLQEIRQIQRVTGQKRQYIVHGPRDLLILNFSEQNMTFLEPVMQNLAQPHVLPAAQYEA
jgi:hypothetical protein